MVAIDVPVKGIVGIHVINVVYRLSWIQIRRCVPLCRVFCKGHIQSIRIGIYRDAVYFADEFTPDITHIVEKIGEPLFHIVSWLRSVYINECSYRAKIRRKGIKIRVMVCFRVISQSHSPGCIAIHHARIHQARFWRLSGWFVACFTVLPSETP